MMTLGACSASAPADHLTVAADPLVLHIEFTPADTCRVTVEDQSFQLPADEQRLLEILRTMKNSRTTAHVAGNVETPYRCLGHVVFVAQRAGFQIGFTAEPPE